MSNESLPLLRPQDEQWKMVLKWVTLLALHYRMEITEPEIRIYYDGLRQFSPERIDRGFYKARQECDFMPKTADVIKRMPEADFRGTASIDIGADFVPVKEWYEKHTKTHNLHVFMDKHGRKKVKQVLASAEHKLENWPQHWDKEKVQPMTWEEASKKIGKIAKEKSL